MNRREFWKILGIGILTEKFLFKKKIEDPDIEFEALKDGTTTNARNLGIGYDTLFETTTGNSHWVYWAYLDEKQNCLIIVDEKGRKGKVSLV